MAEPVLFDNAPLRLKACRHGAMMYLANDMIGLSLDHYGEFAEAEMRVYEAYIQPGAVVLDVGANIGTHSVAFARLAGPSGLVFSFEPQRTIFHLLCGNLAVNRLGNVRAMHAAVGAAKGTIQTPPINYALPGRFNFGAVALDADGVHRPGGETVELITLDTLGLPRCDFLKIDVEGMEQAVLRGGADLIRRTRPVIYLENNREQNSAGLLTWLLGAGYRCYWHIFHYHQPDNHFGASEDIFPGMMEVNVLAVPAGRAQDITDMVEILDPGAPPETP